MSAEATPIRPLRLLRFEIRSEHDLVLARQRARQIAAALGFDLPTQTRITTALSGIARNAFKYAGGGTVEFAVESETRVQRAGAPPRQTLLLTVEDRGPGIPAAALAGQAGPSETGLGLGLIGARRLMDRLEIQSSPAGATAVMRKTLPPQVALRTPAQLQRIVDDLASQPAASPLEEIHVQNQELLRTLEELRTRDGDLTRVNQELNETNSGVLALYDELDTLHRVGLMLAERHNLLDLLQTIIDATTELTGAEVGAFYYHDASSAAWRLHAISGSERAALDRLPLDNPAGVFGDEARAHEFHRIDDLKPGTADCACSHWAVLLAGSFAARSCLFVPVLMANDELAGALVFGHSQPERFTERSERIVAAIAVQAAVGIEKARLFHGLQTASEAKDRFLAMLSHELRTPLNPVTAILSSLTGDPTVPEHLREDVAVMRRNIELQARLIDDLLDFNRIIRGKLQLSRTEVDVHELIRAVILICEPEVTESRHALRVELAAGRANVSGDTARLQQVLWNLLKNAVKFTPPGGTITLRTWLESEDGPLCIEIADTGLGIAPDVLPMIFSAFDQGALQPGRHGGLGLGLAIAKTFIDLHGGDIRAASAGEGQGAQFTLRLPLLPKAETDLAAAPSAASDESAAPAARRILLVEDHADTLRTLARLLTRRGHTVAGAATCAEALALAASATFDIVISDVGLPDRSGLELIAELRRTHSIPAIALSGYGMEADVANSQAAGFNRHLTKPVNFPLLEEAIRDLCSAGQSAAADE